MMKNLLITIPEVLEMHGVSMPMLGWPVKPKFGSQVAEADLDSGSSLRGTPLFRTMELDPKTKPVPLLNLRKTAYCYGSTAAAPPLAIQYNYSDNCPWVRESTMLQIHCYNGCATGETRIHGPLGFSPHGLRSEVYSLIAGRYRTVSTHVEERATTPMSFTRPYTLKERFKTAKKYRKSQPDYDPRIEWINYGQDQLEYDLHMENEEKDLDRRGMARDFDWGSNHLRMAKAIKINANQGIQAGGRDHAVFFTFTFRRIPKDVSPFKYANECFRKAAKKFLPIHFKHWYRVMDVDKGGKLHFHGIAITHQPIFDGFNPESYDAYMESSRLKKLKIKQLRGIRSTVSTNANLRAIWSELDTNLGRFGFGPMHGVFPIRHFPGKFGGGFQTRVAEYMVRMYYRAVPAIKKTTRKKVRACHSSVKYPSKVRAKDIVSTWWQNSMRSFMEIFGFEKPNQFGDLLGRYWATAIINLVDGLDNFTGRNLQNQGWRDFPLKDKAWLAIRLIWMIDHDQVLHDQASALLPGLQECAKTYQPHPDEPQRWSWVPLVSRECTCCPCSNGMPASFVHSVMAALY